MLFWVGRCHREVYDLLGLLTRNMQLSPNAMPKTVGGDKVYCFWVGPDSPASVSDSTTTIHHEGWLGASKRSSSLLFADNLDVHTQYSRIIYEVHN